MTYLTTNEQESQAVIDRWQRDGGTDLSELLETMTVEQAEEVEVA